MSISLLIQILWKTGLCAAGTLLALKLLGRRSAAERSAVAQVGIIALLAIAAATVAAPAWEIEASPEFARYLNPAEAEPPLPATQRIDDRSVPQVPDFTAWAYALPATLLLLTLLLGTARLSSLRTMANPVTDPAWLRALETARRRTGVRQEAALLVSPDVGSPLSWGLFKPAIMLDGNTVRNPHQAEAVLSHELAHVARYDWLKLLLGSVVTALLWFNPLVWLLVRQGNELFEEAADDAVLLSEVSDADYASLLLSVSRDQRNSRYALSNAVAPRPGSLRRRVMRVLESGRNRSPAGRFWSIACLAIAAAVAAPLAVLSPIAARAEAARVPDSGPPAAGEPGSLVDLGAQIAGGGQNKRAAGASDNPAAPRQSGWVLERSPNGQVVKRPATGAEIAQLRQDAKAHEEAVAHLTAGEAELDRAAKALSDPDDRRNPAPPIHPKAPTGAAVQDAGPPPGSSWRNPPAPLASRGGRVLAPSELPVVAKGGERIEVLSGGRVMFFKSP
jgi:beta-lactamase regulating signal transducer with metallopeptidase domain